MIERPAPPEGSAWMAVRKEDVPNFYKLAHLVRTSTRRWDLGFQDTACGATGSPESFTRSAARGKACCPTCKAKV